VRAHALKGLQAYRFGALASHERERGREREGERERARESERASERERGAQAWNVAHALWSLTREVCDAISNAPRPLKWHHDSRSRDQNMRGENAAVPVPSHHEAHTLAPLTASRASALQNAQLEHASFGQWPSGKAGSHLTRERRDRNGWGSRRRRRGRREEGKWLGAPVALAPGCRGGVGGVACAAHVASTARAARAHEALMIAEGLAVGAVVRIRSTKVGYAGRGSTRRARGASGTRAIACLFATAGVAADV
jgi:hypothetical protein